MLSTVHTGQMMDTGRTQHGTEDAVLKPGLVLDYNDNMRLVDKVDMMVSFVDCAKKTVRWHHKLFFHLVDITLLNAYNCMLVWSGKKPSSLRKCTHPVSYQLLKKYGEVTPKHPGSYSVELVSDRLSCAAWVHRHYIQPLPPSPPTSKAKRTKTQRACHVYKYTTQQAKKRQKTLYHCKECNMALCPGENA